jgi:DNA-binding response OmpR family regulator
MTVVTELAGEAVTDYLERAIAPMRAHDPGLEATVLQARGIVLLIDRRRHEIRPPGGPILPLTARQVRLLDILHTRRHAPLTAAQIAAELGVDTNGSQVTIRALVHRARERMDRYANAIETYRHRGYGWSPDFTLQEIPHD